MVPDAWVDHAVQQIDHHVHHDDDRGRQQDAALHDRVDEWLEAGFSKFVLRPAAPPTDWTAELEMLAADILERQT